MTKTANEAKTPSSIRFEYGGKHYVMEYDRAALSRMESELGFDLESVSLVAGRGSKVTISDMLTLSKEVEKLYHGAFFKNHPDITAEEVREIVPKLGDKDKLTDALVGMFSECIETLLMEPEPGEAVAWTTA